MSSPAPKKSKQNNGQAKPQQQQKQQQGGKPKQQQPQQQQKQGKPQQQQGGKPQQQQQGKPKQQPPPQGKKDKKPQQQQGGKPQQQQQQQQKQGPSKADKKKQKQATAAAPAKAAPASKKRPLETKEADDDDDDDDALEAAMAGDISGDDDEDDIRGMLDISDETIEAMSNIQDDLDVIERDGMKQIAKIEKEISTKRQPFYEKRAQLLRTIPHIWQRIFETVDVFSNVLTDNDSKILHHLEHVMVNDHADDGFDVEFEFSENPIFSNKKLSISMKYPPEKEDEDAEDEDEDDEDDPEVTVTDVQYKIKNYVKDNTNSWFVRFFNNDLLSDQDTVMSLQYLKNHIWKSPLEALSGALDEPDDFDESMLMGSDDDDDEDGDAPQLVPAGGEDDDEEEDQQEE